MRRIASVFSGKRSDKSETSSAPSNDTAHSKDSLLSRKKSLKTVPTVEVTVSPALAHNLSSPPTPQLTASYPTSTSSSCSTSLRTPDDTLTRTPSKKAWTGWLARKKSTDARKPSNHDREPPAQNWQQPAVPILRAPPLGKVAAKRAQSDKDESDEDTSSESEDDDELITHTSRTAPAVSMDTPSKRIKSRQNLRIMTSNRLLPLRHTPPLLHLSGSPLFPRSMNISRHLSFRNTLEYNMHRKHILRRLDRRTLSSAEDLSITSLSSGPPQVVINRPSSDLIDIEIPDAKSISFFSPGLRNWVSRGCFEERMVLWLPMQGGKDVSWKHVTADFGVADLEFSEAVEVLAGLAESGQQEAIDETDQPMLLQFATTQTNHQDLTSNSSSQLNVPVDKHKAPYKNTPSPLRIQHGLGSLRGPSTPSSPSVTVPAIVTSHDSSSSPILPSSNASLSPTSPLTTSPIAENTTIKRGVRFAEDDKDDVPLGYVLRIKKRREEKAQFLREERERRAFEQERRKVEQERMKREAERAEWEKEKRAWEKEKRAAEEERKQRLYAEELVAARARREVTRAGGSLGLSSSADSLQIPDNHRLNSGSHSRPYYDSPGDHRRDSSESGYGSGSYYAGSSPGSSQPPSVAGTPPAVGGNLRNSKSSFHSTHSHSSAELGRLPQNDARRGSMASIASSTGGYMPASSPSYFTWSVGQVPQMAQMPMMPMYPVALDLPLLPPTPPFMMQQYPRPRSKTTGSAGPSSREGSRNRSSENVGRSQQQSHTRHSSSNSAQLESRPEHRHSSASQTTSPYRSTHSHRRQASDESPLKSSRSSSQLPVVSQITQSRGRPQQLAPTLPRHLPSSRSGTMPLSYGQATLAPQQTQGRRQSVFS